ncbi:PIR protein [Plasmodium vivax]|uniref:VIR protein n=1 Tax=Plasmodium vivax TaxID=5855 RepID=A0A565A6C0_PLAVI|nr:PIR protein [Plasmodium vivax]
MCSTRSPEEESYEFFEKIEEFIKKAKSAESTTSLSEDENGCNSFMQSSERYITDKETARTICKQFIELYESLTDLKSKNENDHNYIKCSKFLNYWVNFKLSENMKNDDDSVRDVYNAIESQITGSDGHDIFLCFIYDINKDDLYRMNILYNLYDKYIKLKNIIEDTSEPNKQSLLNLSTACCPDYIKASYMCNNDNKNNNPIFCNKLTTFKSKYDALYKKAFQEGSDYANNFIKLEECSNNKIITTAVTGTVVGLIPLFGVLYKFTPMGQMFRSKMGILNNNISNNEEDMTNMSLMEQENEPLRFKQGTYNIKYQSL